MKLEHLKELYDTNPKYFFEKVGTPFKEVIKNMYGEAGLYSEHVKEIYERVIEDEIIDNGTFKGIKNEEDFSIKLIDKLPIFKNMLDETILPINREYAKSFYISNVLDDPGYNYEDEEEQENEPVNITIRREEILESCKNEKQRDMVESLTDREMNKYVLGSFCYDYEDGRFDFNNAKSDSEYIIENPNFTEEKNIKHIVNKESLAGYNFGDFADSSNFEYAVRSMLRKINDISYFKKDIHLINEHNKEIEKKFMSAYFDADYVNKKSFETEAESLLKEVIDFNQTPKYKSTIKRKI